MVAKKNHLRDILLLSGVYALCSLAGAYFVEYYQGIKPCSLCTYQRAILACVVASFPFVWILFQKFPHKKYYLLLPFLYLLNFSIATYHVGVENHLFPSLAQCGPKLKGPSKDIDSLRNSLLQEETVPCDLVPWRLFGLSMAAYNALFSLFFLGYWGYGLWYQRTRAI
jgi:disulfide bond formation protein DsbB